MSLREGELELELIPMIGVGGVASFSNSFAQGSVPPSGLTGVTPSGLTGVHPSGLTSVPLRV